MEKVTTEKRPARCRNRLRDEGKSYPRSNCAECRWSLKSGTLLGCPYERGAGRRAGRFGPGMRSKRRE